MGTFEIKVSIGGMTSDRFIEIDAVADTGSTHTLLPREILSTLGIRSIDRIPFELADQRVVEHEVGEVRLRVDGRERVVLVVFGEEGASPLIGATTLELFNLGVDPVGRKLVPVVGLMKSAGFLPSDSLRAYCQAC
jgi:clan AA aspartic protease